MYNQRADADFIYVALCMCFLSFMILSTITCQKSIYLYIPYVHTFALSVGILLYPLTFFITDLIAEFYGKSHATYCVRLSIIVNLMSAGILMCMDSLPATEWSKVDDRTFHHVFGHYPKICIGSMIASFISQKIDVSLYLWIRHLTQGRYVLVRSTLSTSISLFIDTCVMIGFMGAIHIIPMNKLWSVIQNSYSWKLFFTLCGTPLFYICVQNMRYFMRDSQKKSD